MALIFAQKLTRTYRQRGFLFWSLLYPLQSRFSLQGVATTATAAALCYCHHHYQSGPRSLPSHHLETSWCPGGSRVRTCALGTLTPADLSACVCASAWGISSARAWVHGLHCPTGLHRTHTNLKIKLVRISRQHQQ